MFTKIAFFKILICALLIASQVSCNISRPQTSGNVVGKTNSTGNIVLQIKPSKNNYVYRLGEEVIFTVVTSNNGNSLADAKIKYEIGLEKMTPSKAGILSITSQKSVLPGATLQEPGFLRCSVTLEVNNKSYTDYVTVGFMPELIKPTASIPSDFEDFWHKTISDAADVALSPEFQIIESKSKGEVNTYQLSYQIKKDGKRFYGIICIPKMEGNYPAIIRFPGAGVRPLGGDVATASKGFITLDLNIHSIPLTNNRSYYDSLQRARLFQYQTIGKTSRDSFYYKDVVLGCVKSVDMIFSLPKFNGNLGVWGSSQGGALSLITTALAPKIKNLVVLSPALSDLTGYLYGRAGGWPHLFDEKEKYRGKKNAIREATSYYDVANFAHKINVSGFYSLGFNDLTTPPTTTYGVYNIIKATKQLLIIPEGEHKIYPEQREKSYNWLMGKLKE